MWKNINFRIIVLEDKADGSEFRRERGQVQGTYQRASGDEVK